MSQPSDIPLFRGEETPEEAEKWLETFIDCTGTFSDSGIFRLFFRKFPDGSLAREWFDSLEESSTASWKVFQQQFYARWVTISRQWRDQLAWDAFKKHTLTDDVIFNEESADPESVQNAVFSWVDDHLRLGGAVKASARVLVETTTNLLPTFIRAYLQVYVTSQLPSLEDICSNIRGIPRQILDLERARRQISSAGENPSMERKIEEVSEKVDKLIRAVTQGDGNARLPSGFSNGDLSQEEKTRIGNVSSNESVTWEACSPLTSVMSISDRTSELSTPVAQSTLLPNTSEDSEAEHASTEVRGDALYSIPQEWRKPVPLKTREELIVIAQRAIDFIANYGGNITAPQSQMYIFKSALAIYDKLVNRRVYVNQWLLLNSGSIVNDYDDLIQGIADVRSYTTYQAGDRLSITINAWSAIERARSDGSSWRVLMKPGQTSITWSNTYNLHMDPSGEPSLAGGLFSRVLNNGRYTLMISSVQTALFMTLSSYLAECTGEERYTAAAVVSANCVKNWMIDPDITLVKDCLIDALSAEEQSGASPSCHLTGICIEGFSVLASVTRDDTWRSLSIQMAIAAMRHSDWHSSEGILIVGIDGEQSKDTNAKAFKGLLNRGLAVAYQRNHTNQLFCNLVRSYINLQCSTLIESSRFENSYGIEWRGPYKGPYIHGQIAALDTIIAAIGVNE